MKLQVFAVAALAVGCASAARADILWDQSSLGWSSNGFYNTISGAPPFGSTAYAASDVTVPAGGWQVNSVSMYFTCFDFSWNSETTGRLYIQPKTGAMPTVLPGGSLIDMTVELLTDDSVGQAYYKVTASGLSNVLTPGEWWVGITPVAAAGPFGPEIGLATANPTGATTANYDLGGSGWADTTVDAAILIEGTVPAPASAALLGLGGLAMARRRRA